MKVEESRCVYVLYNPQTGLTKIGSSGNPSNRQSQVEAACGCKLDLIYQSRHLICPVAYEHTVQGLLFDHRTIGEWFKLENPREAIAIIEREIEGATEDPIVENYKMGHTISKIAHEYNVSRQAILARLKKYGVYDSNGNIHEKIDQKPNPLFKTKFTPSEGAPQYISTVEDKYDDTMYLDGVEPNLPLHNLKRIEPNLNYNGEWYQIAIFKDGEFIYAYTKDINKARAYVQGVRALYYANGTRKPI